MSETFTRRDFIRGSAASAAGIMMAPDLNGSLEKIDPRAGYDIMRELAKYRKIDAYATSSLTPEHLALQLDFADRLGIEKMFIAMPMTEIKATPDEFRAMNEAVYKAVRSHPGRLVGQFTFNPRFLKESLAEIDRCVDRGMIGTRVYHQVKINDPAFYPVIEKFIDLKMILFVHGESQLGVGGYRMKYDAKKSHVISVPEDFTDVAGRYPEAMFQFPHLGGGGDWEYMCKAFKGHPNIYVDIGGSNNQEFLVDFAVRTLGEDRVLFGSDSSFYQAAGKVLSSNLTDGQKKKVFFENYRKILKKGGYDVD